MPPQQQYGGAISSAREVPGSEVIAWACGSLRGPGAGRCGMADVLRRLSSPGSVGGRQPAAAALHRELDAVAADVEPRLLHHDLQPGDLIRTLHGRTVLLDWELAAFGDPLSDLAPSASGSTPPACSTSPTGEQCS